MLPYSEKQTFICDRDNSNSNNDDILGTSGDIHEALHVMKRELQNADAFLEDKLDNRERKDVGKFVKNFCSDLADGIHEIALQVKADREQDRKRQELFYTTIVEDAHRLVNDISPKSKQYFKARKDLTQREVNGALAAAETLLFDLTDALRSISDDEARDVAELGLVVSRIFIGTLIRAIEMFLEHKEIEKCSGQSNDLSIEVLHDEDDYGFDGDDTNIDKNTKKQPHSKRVRALWPPLLPIVTDAGKIGLGAALQRPILATALALVLWPTFLCTAFLAAPLFVMDNMLQTGYNCCQETTLIVELENAVGGACQIGKLYYLCGKLFVKRGLRIGQRQIERKGGLYNIMHEVGNHSMHCALHPIETGHRIISSVSHTWTYACHVVSTMQHMNQSNI